MTENDTNDVDEAILKILEAKQFVRRKDLFRYLLEGVEIPDTETVL